MFHHMFRMLSNRYEYRRRLPHFQKEDRPIFITFRRGLRAPLPDDCRDEVLRCCLRGTGTRFHLHAAVVMPEHVHLLLTPMRDPNGDMFWLADILKGIKGIGAARESGVGKLWTAVVGRIVRSCDSQRREHAAEDRLHPAESGTKRTGGSSRGIPVAVGQAGVGRTSCGADILVRQIFAGRNARTTQAKRKRPSRFL